MKEPMNTSTSSLINHARPIRKIIENYCCDEAKKTSLLKALGAIVKSLEYTPTEASANFDFLRFVIQLLPGRNAHVSSLKIALAVHDYYRKTLKPELLKNLIHVKDQVQIDEFYSTQLVNHLHIIHEKWLYVDKILAKNAHLILDLHRSLNEKYLSFIADDILDQVEESYALYKDARGELQGYEMENLEQHRKLCVLKSEIQTLMSSLKRKETLHPRSITFYPVEDMVDAINRFTEKHLNAKLHYFVGIKDNQNEFGLMEWLIQNQEAIHAITEQSKEENSRMNMDSLWVKIKTNWMEYFSLGDKPIKIESMKTHFECFQQENTRMINTIRVIRFKAIMVAQGLLLLKDSLQENGLYFHPTQPQEGKEVTKEPLAISFAGFLQRISASSEAKRELEDKNKVSPPINTPVLVASVIATECEESNKVTKENRCSIM